jgi:hypothetical protein
MPLMTVSNHDTGSSSTVKATIWAILGRGLLENDDQTVEIVFQVSRCDVEAAGRVRWD